MVNVTATRTAEALAVPTVGVDDAARAARLRRVGGRNLDERSARPRELIAQHLGEAGPSGSGDMPREVVVLDHAGDVELFDDHRSVALGVGGRQLVQHVVALTAHLAVQTHHANLSLLSILRSFLPSRDGSLRSGQPSKSLFEVSGVDDEPPVGVGEQVRDASVDGDNRLEPGQRVGHFNLAQDRRKPLVAVAAECAGFRFALKWAVYDGAKVPELREAEHVAIETPHLRVRLGEREEVASFALPARLSSEPFEASLPRLVEFNEQGGADVAWHIGQPRQLGAKIGQLVDLVERGRVALVLAAAGQSNAPLLKGEVPQEPERTFPRCEPSNLLLGRVDAEPKALENLHALSVCLVCATRKRLSHGPSRSLQPERPLGLRAEVPQEGHHVSGFRRASHGLAWCMRGLRVRVAGVGVRIRPCAPSGLLPTQGGAFGARQLAQGRVGSAVARGTSVRRGTEALGRSLLVALVLRRLLRRSPAGDRQALRGATTGRGFLPALNGGVSASENR